MPRCRFCKEKYQPTRPMQPCCDKFECKSAFMVDHVQKQRKQRTQAERIAQQADRKVIKLKLEDMKPLSYFADKAQRAVNAWIRERDKDEPCISCGRFHGGKWNAGHYVSRVRSPALRYHPDNIHKQCEPCNTSLSGNLIEYRKNLIEKIGIKCVEWLETEHQSPRWRREDYERIEAEAKAKLKELRN